MIQLEFDHFLRTLIYIVLKLKDHFNMKYMTHHCLPDFYVNLYLKCRVEGKGDYV